MTQHQRQSSSGQSQDQDASQSASLAEPAKPDATSPYEGPADKDKPERRPDQVADRDGPEQMEQPYFSEAQSTLGAFAPAERPGDPFAQPEDPIPSAPSEQPPSVTTVTGAEFATDAGTVRAGMSVVDSYGHALGTVSSIEGEKIRLASTDPHDDGVAFLPVSLIDGIDGDRVLLSGRGDASFGMSGE